MKYLGLNYRHAESGLTIMEMMVAMLIGVILLAGLVTIFASMRRSFSATQALNHLVNQQQFASTELTNAISSAGYYPAANRTIRGQYPTVDDAFPVDQTLTANGKTIDFATAGQFIYGTGSTGTNANDMVAVRMINIKGATSQGPYDCLGSPGAATAGRAFSVFWVDPNKNQLMCATQKYPNGQPLVGGDALTGTATGFSGVKSLAALYGVDTNRDGSVNRFMTADKLNSDKICPDVTTGTGNSSSCWPYVRSVRFKLGFITSLNGGKTSIYLTRTVRLNNTNGMTLKSMPNVVAGN